MGQGAGGTVAQTPEAERARQKARLLELLREATDLLKQAPEASAPRDQAGSRLTEAGRRLEALASEGDSPAGAKPPRVPLLPPELREELRRAAADLRGLAPSSGAAPFSADSCLRLLGRVGARLKEEPLLDLDFQGSYTQAKVAEPVYGGHASAMGPPPTAAPGATAGGPSPVQFEEVPGLAVKTYCGGPSKDHILESGGSGVAIFDYDGDGLPDIYVVNAFELDEKRERIPHRNALYRNLGHWKFKDVSKEMNLQHRGWSGDASFCDLNQDGYPDLYVLNMQGDDQYYENDQGKRFREKTAAYFPKTPWGAMGIKFFDWNLDGLMDLFVTDMHSDMTEAQTKVGKRDLSTGFEKRKSEAWCSIEWTDAFLQGASNNLFGNAFYQNQGNGLFVEVSDKIGVETYWPWGISVADLNADGYEDVFVTAGMGYPFRYGINSVLLNENGRRFVDSEFVLGVEPRKNNRIEKEYFTLDCSGADKNHSLAYHKKGIVGVIGSISSRSSVALDLDDDGDLDIVTNEQNDRPQVLVSNLSEKKRIHFLKVRLIGTASNRDGLGATVKVHCGSKTYTRYHDGKCGYLAQSAVPLYFGLGDADKIDRVEVFWPSGRKQTISEDIPVNSLLTITETR